MSTEPNLKPISKSKLKRTTIPISEIIVEDRQRLTIDNRDGIKESIQEKGLIQPIILSETEDGSLRLLTGGRRLHFITELGHTHLHHGSILNPDKPGFLYSKELPPDELFEIELLENIKRVEMSWQERCLNVQTIHQQKQTRAAKESKSWGQRETGELCGIDSKSHVSNCLTIAKLLRLELDPDNKPLPTARFWLCASVADAWRLLLRDEEDALNKELARRSQAEAQEYHGSKAYTCPIGFMLDLPPEDQQVVCIVCSAQDKNCPHCRGSGVSWKNGRQICQIPIVGFKKGVSLDTEFAEFTEVIETDSIQEQELKLLQEFRNARSELQYRKDVITTEFFPLVERLYLKANPEATTESFLINWNEKIRELEEGLIVVISNKFHKGDSITFMNDPANAGRFDHIITDIPYGIDMTMLNQQNQHGGMVDIDTVEELHDVNYNLKLIADFFPAAYHCTGPNAFVITWADQMLWQYMYDHAIKAGFAVQRWPITWVKKHRCMNQCNSYNTTKDTEIAIVCRKKGATLLWQPDTSIIEAARDELCEAVKHPFAKPELLWQHLTRMVSVEGHSILEPFMGRGSGVISMLRMNRNVTGVELDENHFNAALENVKQEHYLKINPNYQFK
jgi:DNA modification methylase